VECKYSQEKRFFIKMALFDSKGNSHLYDVVICGGGLAGATLARQLKLSYPDITVIMLDRQQYPVPEAGFKVGESTVEIAGFYLSEIIKLESYLEQKHIPKQGLRYFWNSFQKNFGDRPEVGLSNYTPCKSYQIDRGIFENDLFQMNTELGLMILDGVQVIDIVLNVNPGEWHEVSFIDKFAAEKRVQGRWVIDAMGRLRFLQSKLGLKKEFKEEFNAVWFRVKGRLDVEDFVPVSESDWHLRVPNRQRYNSTNHLMGKGYWIWLIPLCSGNTSIGIVTSGEYHDFSTTDTLSKSIEWLKKHDPFLANQIHGAEFLDFGSIRNYNYSSKQIFSTDRWACIGEAAIFSDPFYSPGSNFIGFENTIITSLIGDDYQKQLCEKRVKFYNEFILSQNDWLDYNLHTAYSYFGNPLIMSLAFLWDTAVGWGIATPQMFNSIYLNEEMTNITRNATSNFYALALQVKNLFKQWEVKICNRYTFKFIDYYQIPFIKEIYSRSLINGKSCQEVFEDHLFTMEKLEEFAQVIFIMAVEDTMPLKLSLLGNPIWVNAWAIGLEDDNWENDGLFQLKTKKRDISPMLKEIRQLYHPSELAIPQPDQTVTIELNLSSIDSALSL
jgi:flavin-dependent dehydrogenase